MPKQTFRATLGDTLVAESSRTVTVEGNAYFPPDDVNWEHLAPSPKTTVCHWKGEASYFDVLDGDRAVPAAAWTYESPNPAAEEIAHHVAFWGQVEVRPVTTDAGERPSARRRSLDEHGTRAVVESDTHTERTT